MKWELLESKSNHMQDVYIKRYPGYVKLKMYLKVCHGRANGNDKWVYLRFPNWLYDYWYDNFNTIFRVDRNRPHLFIKNMAIPSPIESLLTLMKKHYPDKWITSQSFLKFKRGKISVYDYTKIPDPPNRTSREPEFVKHKGCYLFKVTTNKGIEGLCKLDQFDWEWLKLDENLKYLRFLYNHYVGYIYYHHRTEHKTKRTYPLHRLILQRMFPNKDLSNLHVDHINRDKLDNRRENLRVATRQQNQLNARATIATSKFKGVFYTKDKGTPSGGFWVAQLTVNPKKWRCSHVKSELFCSVARDWLVLLHCPVPDTLLNHPTESPKLGEELKYDFKELRSNWEQYRSRFKKS